MSMQEVQRDDFQVPAAPQRMASAEDRGITSWLAAVAWCLAFAFAFWGSLLIDIPFRNRWLPVLVIAFLVIISRLRLFIPMAPYINKGMILMLLWAVASAAWAPSAVFVVTQSISAIGVSMMALAFVLAGWYPERFERLMAITIAVLLVMSLVVAITMPEIGIHSGTDVSLRNSWRGVTFQKNGLGQLASVGVILFTFLWASGRIRTLWAISGLLLSLFMVLKSRSSTSLMLALISCMGVVMILRPQLAIGWLGRRITMTFLIVALPLGIYLAVATPYIGFIGGYFGKDATFSGRTLIWQAILDEVATRPLQGSGLSSFWNGANAGEARVQFKSQWKVSNGHNGYIDILNELGLVGLFMFLGFIVIHSLGLAKLARISREHYALHMPLFIYLLLANVSESGWMFLIAPTHLIGMYTSLEVSRLVFADAVNRAQDRWAAHSRRGTDLVGDDRRSSAS